MTFDHFVRSSGRPSAEGNYAAGMDRLGNARAVIGWLAWVALAITIALGVVKVIMAERPPTVATLLQLSERMANPIFFVVLALAVLGCALPHAVPRVRLLAALSAVLTAMGLVFAVVLTALSVRASTPILDASWNLPSLILCGLSTAVLIGLARRSPAAAPAVREPQEEGDEESPELSAIEAAPSPPDQELQPTWRPEDAAGAVWMTAGDAASGASASGWGSSTADSGWQPSIDNEATAAPDYTDTGSKFRPEPPE